MPKKLKTSEQILRSTKNQSISAADRRNRHHNDIKRRNREITELQNHLKECRISQEGPIVKITPKKPSRRASVLLNSFAYIANKGVVATQTGNDTFIYSNDFNLFVNNNLLQLKETADLKEVVVSGSNTNAPEPPINQLFIPEEEIRTPEQRKNYHENNPDRYRRDVNILKIFFEKPYQQDRKYDDKELCHRIVTALNNFSYVINISKVATQHDLTLTLFSEHHQAIKNHIDKLSVHDHRMKDPKPIDEKLRYHDSHPERKHADYTAAKNMLLQINSTSVKISENTIAYTASSTAAAKTLHQIWTRSAYLVGKDYVTQYSNNVVKMSLENFNLLFKIFFPNQENKLQHRMIVKSSTQKGVTPQFATMLNEIQSDEHQLDFCDNTINVVFTDCFEDNSDLISQTGNSLKTLKS